MKYLNKRVKFIKSVINYWIQYVKKKENMMQLDLIKYLLSLLLKD